MTENKTSGNDRAEYIAGMRLIADWLEAHPAVPLPNITSTAAGKGFEPTLIAYLLDDEKAEMAAIARAMGQAEKVYSESLGQMRVVRRFAGIAYVASADRDKVCEKVVVATREVTEEVPDPEALAAVPMVSVTKTVEDVEWRCTSILADRPADLVEVAR